MEKFIYGELKMVNLSIKINIFWFSVWSDPFPTSPHELCHLALQACLAHVDSRLWPLPHSRCHPTKFRGHSRSICLWSSLPRRCLHRCMSIFLLLPSCLYHPPTQHNQKSYTLSIRQQSQACLRPQPSPSLPAPTPSISSEL